MKYILYITLLLLFSCANTVLEPEKDILNEAVTAFNNENYDEALKIFTELLSKESVSDQANAYTGLGYVQMRINKHEDAYQSFKKGITLETDTAKNDLLSGLCFLEYSLNADLNQSISYGEQLIASDVSFKMRFDKEVNVKDVSLTIAQSYFGLKKYSDCLKEVQRLGKLTTLNPNQPNIETYLLDTLKVLTVELSN